jgi:hypothetical protein
VPNVSLKQSFYGPTWTATTAPQACAAIGGTYTAG